MTNSTVHLTVSRFLRVRISFGTFQLNRCTFVGNGAGWDPVRANESVNVVNLRVPDTSVFLRLTLSATSKWYPVSFTYRSPMLLIKLIAGREYSGLAHHRLRKYNRDSIKEANYINTLCSAWYVQLRWMLTKKKAQPREPFDCAEITTIVFRPI